MNLTMMLVFAVMAYGALGYDGKNILDDFRLGVQYCKSASSCSGSNNGRIKYTKYLLEGGGWSKWSGKSSNFWKAFRVGIFTKDGEAEKLVRIQGVDFRFWIEVDKDSNHQSTWSRHTGWASEGGGWSAWASPSGNGHDIRWIRVRLEVRALPSVLSGLVITNLKIGAWASTAPNSPGDRDGTQRFTSWLTGTSGGWTGFATGTGRQGLEHVKIYVEAKSVHRTDQVGAITTGFSQSIYNGEWYVLDELCHGRKAWVHEDGKLYLFRNKWRSATLIDDTYCATYFERYYEWGTKRRWYKPGRNPVSGSLEYVSTGGSPAMAVEKEAMNSDLEVVGEPSNEWNPMVFAALIGAAAFLFVAVLVVMLGRWMKRKQLAKEPVAEMSEVADTPNVVHVAEETAEAVTTGTAPETETETVAAAPEAAVEVVVKEEAVEMEAVSGGDVL